MFLKSDQETRLQSDLSNVVVKIYLQSDLIIGVRYIYYLQSDLSIVVETEKCLQSDPSIYVVELCYKTYKRVVSRADNVIVERGRETLLCSSDDWQLQRLDTTDRCGRHQSPASQSLHSVQ